MSQNESTTFLVTDAKNLTLIDATRENSPWCILLLMESFPYYGWIYLNLSSYIQKDIGEKTEFHPIEIEFNVG